MSQLLSVTDDSVCGLLGLHNSILNGPVPQQLQNPSRRHGRCSVISCILISPNCSHSNKSILSWNKSFHFKQCVREEKDQICIKTKHVTQKVKKSDKYKLFHANEENKLCRVLGVGLVSDEADPECFHTSEHHDK